MNKNFYFYLKQNISSFKKPKHIFPFLIAIFIFTGIGCWIFIKNNNRLITSLPQKSLSPAQKIPAEVIHLDPLLIRLKNPEKVQFSKVEFTFYISDSEAVSEIQQSIKQIRDHLIFILSDKDQLAFTDPDKQSELKEEIMEQLNFFLIAGRIQRVDFKQTILN